MCNKHSLCPVKRHSFSELMAPRTRDNLAPKLNTTTTTSWFVSTYSIPGISLINQNISNTVSNTLGKRHFPPLHGEVGRVFSSSSTQARKNISGSSCIRYLVANIALREEKVAASSFKAFSSFRSFIMVSVTIAFSFSYLLFRLARATSAVCCLPKRTEIC